MKDKHEIKDRPLHSEVRKDLKLIRGEAQQLFEALQRADNSKDQNWHTFPSPDVGLYWVRTDRPGWTTGKAADIPFGFMPRRAFTGD